MNGIKLHRWGAGRAVDLRDMALDHRVETAAKIAVPGFIDISAALGGGIYLLASAGEIVFIGRASSAMLAKIAAHRHADRPKFLASIAFDQVLIRHVHPDLAADLYYELLAEYSPKHNRVCSQNHELSSSPTPLHRRL